MPMPFESAAEQVGALVVSSSNAVYAAVNISYSQGILIYSDPTVNSGTWQPINGFFYNYFPDNGIINALAIESTNIIYVATSAGSPISSNNQPDYHGNVYSIQLGNFLPSKQLGLGSAPDHGVMNSVLVESGTVYAASGGYTISSDGSTAYFGDVYSADNAGVHAWRQVGGGSTPDHGVANSIVLSNDKSSIYVATSSGNVYKSSVSAGGVWSTALGEGTVPDGSAINSVAVANNGIIYAATTLGNVYSLSGNSHWQQVGGGAAPDGWSINALAVYGTKVYVATQGGHVYVVNFPQS